MDDSIGIDLILGSTNRPGEDGALSESFLVSERRSKKVGNLPDNARMVLSAARHCFPADLFESIALGNRVGVSIGTVYGSMSVAEKCLTTAKNEGFREVTPSWYATGLPNATAAIVASVHGLRGPNHTLLGYSAGIEAIILGCRQIMTERADEVLAGGFDLMSSTHASKLGEAPEYNDAAALYSGAGLVWLSRRNSAKVSQARIIGWSQSVRFNDESDQSLIERLTEMAVRDPDKRQSAVRHLVYPGRPGKTDYLAATAPIYLVESILHSGVSGNHVLVVRGFGDTAACLAVEVLESAHPDSAR